MVLLLLGTALYLGAAKPPPSSRTVYIAEKTSRVPGLVAPEVREQVHRAAEQGGGQVVSYAVGRQVFRLPPVDLSVSRDGARDDDPGRRTTAIEHRLDALSAALARAPVGDEGFNLSAALQIAADESNKTADRIDIWLQTALLDGSRDPLQISKLTAADAKAAVAELIQKSSIGKLNLSHVVLHPVLISPVGTDQQPLTPADEAWASDFITELGSQLGAQVDPPVHSRATGPAWNNASVVPPIQPREDKTPDVPPATAQGAPPPVVIDTAGAFGGDSSALLDPAGTQQKLTDLVGQYNAAKGKYTVQVTGFCAHFGARLGAIDKSRDRANVIGQLLTTSGVRPEDLHTDGLGFDVLADPSKDPQSAAQRVVIVRLQPRS